MWQNKDFLFTLMFKTAAARCARRLKSEARGG